MSKVIIITVCLFSFGTYAFSHGVQIPETIRKDCMEKNATFGDGTLSVRVRHQHARQLNCCKNKSALIGLRAVIHLHYHYGGGPTGNHCMAVPPPDKFEPRGTRRMRDRCLIVCGDDQSKFPDDNHACVTEEERYACHDLHEDET